MKEHRKKLGCRWSRVIFHLFRCLNWALRLAARIKAVVRLGDLMISTTLLIS